MEKSKSKIIWIIGAATLLVAAIILVVFVFLNNGNKDNGEAEADDGENEVLDIEIIEDSEEPQESQAVKDLKGLNLLAYNSSEYGIDVDTDFVLTIEDNLDITQEEAVRHLSISPAVDFEVEKIQTGEFVIKIKEDFDPNEVIKVSFTREGEDFGWAFQTVSNFDLLRSLPTNNAWDVPKNSGIEMLFTKEVPEGIDEYFSISPYIDGTFTYEGNKVTFIPYSDMIADSQYSVTIRAGYGYDDDLMLEDQIISFHTEYYWANEQPISFPSSNQLFVQGEAQRLTFSLYDTEVVGTQADLTIYELTDADAYMMGIHNIEGLSDYDEIIDLIEYQSQSTFSTFVKAKDEAYTSSGWIDFEQGLDRGYYLIRIDLEGSNFYEFVQVGPYQAYVAEDEDELLIWAIDSRIDDGAANLSVYVDGEFYGVTDDSGICQTNIGLLSEENVEFVLLADASGNQLVVDMKPIPNWYGDYYGYDYGSNMSYWTFLDTDRSNYLTTDDVHYFGFIQSRSGERLNQVTVKLKSNLIVLDEIQVDVSAIGSFSGQFHIDDYQFGNLFIEVYDDRELVGTKYISVGDFSMPTYQLEVEADTDVIMLGESVEVALQSNFFDGMPVPNSTIEIRSDGYYDYLSDDFTSSITLETDENGYVDTSFIPYSDTDSWQPHYYTVTGINNAYQEYYSTSSDSFILFPRDTMIEINSDTGDGSVRVYGDVSKIDMDGFDGAIYEYDDYRGAPVASKAIQVQIMESYTDKIFIGQVYDEISHVTYDEYEYNYIEEMVASITVNTDEYGVFDIPYYAAIDGRNYTYSLTLYDGADRIIRTSESISYNILASASYEGLTEDYYSFYVETDQYQYEIGETIHLGLKYSGSPVGDNETNQVMYLICQDGFKEVEVAETLETEVVFREEYVPNIVIKSIYYNGQDMIELMSSHVRFDYTERELSLEIETDQDIYGVGDTVTGTIQLEDSNGNPVMTDYVISVVDEAYFAVYEDWDNLMMNLYSSVYDDGILKSGIASGHNRVDYFWGAEGGDGYSEGYIRSDFEVTADYIVGTTGSDGNDEFSFDLPDNLTEWRLSGIAVSGDLKLGLGRDRIVTSQDYYVNMSIADTYIAGDDIYFTMNSAGEGLEGLTEYQIEIVDTSGNNEDIIINEQGNNRDYITAHIGQLPAASYQVTVSGSNGQYSDAMMLPFDVVDTYQEIETIRTDTLESYQVPDTGHIVRLQMTNKAATEQFNELYNIYSMQNNRRLDIKLAGIIAGQYLNDTYDSDLQVNDIEDINQYLSGYILSELDYSGGDPVLTAQVLSMDTNNVIDPFTKTEVVLGLKEYLTYEYIEANEWFACIWGLAAEQQPILLDLYEAMAAEADDGEDLTYAKMYALMALIDIGDLENAKAYYNELTGDYLDDSGSTGDRKMDAILMMAASRLELVDEADAFYEILDLSSDIESPTIMERTIYFIMKEPEFTEASFTYSLEGESQNVNLSQMDSFYIDLDRDQVDEIEFSDIEGDIDVHTTYIGTPQDMVISDDIQIERLYTVNGQPVTDTNVHQGDVIEIEFIINVSDDVWSVSIEDVLPAGLVYYSQVYGDYYSYASVNDKEVSMVVYKSSQSNIMTVQYRAIATSVGSYNADYLVIQNLYGIGGQYVDQESMVINP